MENDSLFLLISNNIGKDGELPVDFKLPRKDEQKMMFADGALDGMYIYHMGHKPLESEESNTLNSLLKLASDGKEKEAEDGFIEFLNKNGAICIIDDIQQYIVKHSSELNPENMYRFAVHMMMFSNNIECVKVGMIILELFNTENNEKLAKAIRTIGLSDEFTIFSVFLMRKWTNGAMEILQLAKHVHSWGRIHCMDFIEPENDTIKLWILENGVDNGVVPAYSGLVAFEKADVTTVLESDNITRGMMHGILKIASALLDEGPVRGISTIENAEQLLEKIVNKALEKLPLEVSDYEVLKQIGEWLNEKSNNKEVSEKLKNDVFSDENVKEQVKIAVKSGEAISLAEYMEIPYKNDIYDLIVNDFDNKFYLVNHIINDDEYFDKILALFEEKIDLDKIATGPDSKTGIGKEYNEHRKIDFILSGLISKPGKGEKIIKAALMSPVVRNRNMAFNVLKSWVEAENSSLKEISLPIYETLNLVKEKEVKDELVQKYNELLN